MRFMLAQQRNVRFVVNYVLTDVSKNTDTGNKRRRSGCRTAPHCTL